MDMQSLSNLSNWLYFENDTHGTFKQCKKAIFKEFPELEEDKFKDNWDKIFTEKLYNLNCYALKKCYGNSDFPEFEYKEANHISKIQCLKSVQCWLYQCAEGDADTKPLYLLMQKIERILLNAIILDLEEYKKADWN